MTSESRHQITRSLLVWLYAWANRRLYHELAWAYDLVAWCVSAGQWATWRRAVLAGLPPGNLLEIGFGTGGLLCEMAQAGWRVTGVEPSPAMQRVSAARLARCAVAVERVQASAQALPFAAAAFDAIVVTFPAEYILDPHTLAEVGRVLRPGGVFVIGGLWVALHNNALGRLLPLFYGRPSAAFVAKMRTELERAGFEVTVGEVNVGSAAVGLVRAVRR